MSDRGWCKVRGIGITPAMIVVSALLMGGCATSSDPIGSAGSSVPAATSNNGAFVVERANGSGIEHYPIGSDGKPGAPVELLWETGTDSAAARLLDAVGPSALTATYDPPLTDVTGNKALQVRDIGTGQVSHQLKVPGWCSGPDGADYPCVLLDDTRLARTTPLDGIGPGKVTISSTDSGQTLAKFGPFPALIAVRATSSPDVLVLISYDSHSRQHKAERLDISTGQTAPIGSLPISQPWLCVLGTDSVLTVKGAKLQVVGPASVAAIEVPELAGRGPGALGCTPDGGFLYVRTDWEAEPNSGLVIDAINLHDGTRTAGVLTLPEQQVAVRVTR